MKADLNNRPTLTKLSKKDEKKMFPWALVASVESSKRQRVPQRWALPLMTDGVIIM